MNYGKPKLLKTYGRVSKAGVYYPPILEEDPELAAQSLTISDSVLALENLTKAFTFSGEFPVLEDSIRYSIKNYNWFTSFFLCLAKVNCQTVDPVLEIKEQLPDLPKLAFQDPFHHSSHAPVYDRINIKAIDPISKHRVAYIGKHFSLSDFRGGYPIWYQLTDTTVYENYNEKLNARIKVVHKSGEFMYFISGASDDWHQIHNVPIEIDYVVSALIYRN